MLLEGPRHPQRDAQGDDLGQSRVLGWLWGMPQPRVGWQHPLGGSGTASLARPCVNDLAAADRSSPSAFLSH